MAINSHAYNIGVSGSEEYPIQLAAELSAMSGKLRDCFPELMTQADYQSPKFVLTTR